MRSVIMFVSFLSRISTNSCIGSQRTTLNQKITTPTSSDVDTDLGPWRHISYEREREREGGGGEREMERERERDKHRKRLRGRERRERRRKEERDGMARQPTLKTPVRSRYHGGTTKFNLFLKLSLQCYINKHYNKTTFHSMNNTRRNIAK